MKKCSTVGLGMEFGMVLGMSHRPAWMAVLAALTLAACQTPPPPRPLSPGHLSTRGQPAVPAIPPPVRRVPLLPPPKPAPPAETYTVVVNNVPVRELLFAVARDAKINIDVDPRIEGRATLNAINQTLPQILDRVARQADLRYTKHGETLVIEPDTPFLRNYRIDYVNMSRDTTGTVSVATQIATTGGSGGGGGGGGGGNNSTTKVESKSNNQFWQTLAESVRALIAGDPRTASDSGTVSDDAVIANPESGVLLVRATSRQHRKIRAYIDEVLASARRQVLIEATIAEVELSDKYQAGIDFNKLARNGGFTLAQSLLGANLATAPFFLLQAADSRDAAGNPNGQVALTVRLLKQFGNTRVLSSPKLMVLNNQTALLKVVNNIVYFNVTSDTTVATQGGNNTVSVNTEAQTVPVGIVMAVTPQISRDDEVNLNVRPTISRVTTFVTDPNPALTLPNLIPQVQVREMESMLRVRSGQLAVLGGLMQDSVKEDSSGVPVLSAQRDVGDLFKFRNNDFTKTELVIFLRPWVIRTPSVNADLRSFKPFLPENLKPAVAQNMQPAKKR